MCSKDFSLPFYKLYLFFTTGEEWKKVKYLMKKWKRINFFVIHNAKFHFTRRKKKLSNSQGVMHYDSVATFGVNSKPT